MFNLKSKFMKNSIQFIILVTVVIIFQSCEILPDLNPNTGEGSDISVFSIMDTIIDNNSMGVSQYDLDSDGVNEFRIEYYKEDVSGGIAPCPISISVVNLDVNGQTFSLGDFGQFLPNDVITGINGVFGSFTTSQVKLFEASPFCLRSSGSSNSVLSTRYVVVKLNINNNTHYAWLEFHTNITSQTNTYFSRRELILTRVGVANQPNFVLRTGQTK